MTAHAHRWRIETPNGPTSTGRCECGAVKEHWNSTRQDRGDVPLQRKKLPRMELGQGVGGFDGWRATCDVCGEEMARSMMKKHRQGHSEERKAG